MNSKHKDKVVSKNTYYRFLNETSYNWGKFLLLLAAKVTSAFDSFTRPERRKVLVLDDSVIKRNRSKKKVELLANRRNRYQKSSDSIDHRTNGYKSCKEGMLQKTEAAILLVQRALNAGIKADYILMDTWFTTEPLLKELLKTGINAIGMVKQLKQRYLYHGKLYTLPELQKFMQLENPKNIFGSLVVATKSGIPVKIVFVRNRNKNSDWIISVLGGGNSSCIYSVQTVENPH